MGDIDVVSPTGEIGTVPEEDYQSAVANEGYRPATREDIIADNRAKKYGTPGQEARTAAEEAARVLTFGASDLAQTQLGVNPKDILAREQENPKSRIAGGAAALVPSMLTGEGETGLPEAEIYSEIGGTPSIISKVGNAASKATESVLPEANSFVGKILRTAASKGVGSAVEGLAYTTGDLVSEKVLGDPNLTSQQAIAQLGLGAVLGGGLGALLGPAGEVYKAVRGEITPEVKKAVLQNNIRRGADEAMDQVPNVPGSIEDIMSRTKGKSDLLDEGMPSKQMLSDADQMFGDSEYPVHKVQLESLNDPDTRQFYKNLKESNTDTGKALSDYEALQKKEGVKKIDETIQGIAPDSTVTGDSTRAFDNLKSDFTSHYNEEKQALEPAFKSFDKAGVRPISDAPALISKLDEAIPGASDHISYDGKDLKLAPYKASMPFSKDAYSAMKEVIEGANDPDLTLEGLRNIRKTISDRINWDTNPRVAQQLSSIKKSLMDHMISEVSKSEPDLAVRDTFKRYAINEQNREALEKVLGGSFSDKASLGKQISPEDAINKIFSNTNTVKATKEILGKETFNKTLANYMKMNFDKVTDNAGIGFSSKKFATFLKTKFPELKESFIEDAPTFAKIKAITDKLRILPDSARANPSETATTLKNMGIIDKLKSISQSVINPHGFAAEQAMKLFRNFGEMSDNARLSRVFDAMNEGKTLPEAQDLAESRMIHTGVLKKVEDLKNKTTRMVEKGAKSLFDSSGYTASKAAQYLSDNKSEDSVETYEKRSKQINDYVNNFDQQVDKLDSSTSKLYPHAPDTSAAMQQTLNKGMQFLATKLPPNPSLGLLIKTPPPSEADISKFNKYYDAAESPLSVFDEIKTGMLSQETTETLQNIYPDLLDHMKTEIIHNAAEKEEMPYDTKLQLAMLFGQDLDMSMSSDSIMKNQAKLSQPEPQQKPTQGGLQKLQVSNRFTTPQQKTAAREA